MRLRRLACALAALLLAGCGDSEPQTLESTDQFQVGLDDELGESLRDEPGTFFAGEFDEIAAMDEAAIGRDGGRVET